MERLCYIMDRLELVKQLFRIESTDNNYKFRGFEYTELEITDLLDMVAILDAQGLYELYEYCPEMFNEVVSDYLSTPHVGKKLSLALFLPLEHLTVMLIMETEPRVLDVLDLRSKLEKQGKDLSDYNGDEI